MRYMLINKIIENKLKRMDLNSEKGASLVEYGLLVALIAVVCILAITDLGQTISTKFLAITSALLGI